MNWTCRSCVGGDGLPANEALRVARGSCGGPFPLGPDGKPLLDDAQVDPTTGEVFVPGDYVLNSPRYESVRWDRCPLALTNRPGCPEPRVPAWLLKVTEYGSYLNSGGTLRDCVDDPPDVLRAAVALARHTAARVREADREAARTAGKGKR